MGREFKLIFDEVITGFRVAYGGAQSFYGVKPDLTVLGKVIGGGFPIGAVIAKRAIAETLTPGTHATTYGGSPLGCACILAVIEAIKKQALLERVNRFSPYILKRLEKLKARVPFIKDVRGRGFMIGIELTIDGRPLVDACRTRRLLINCTQERVLRLLPAMTITKAQLDRALQILEDVLTHYEVSSVPAARA